MNRWKCALVTSIVLVTASPALAWQFVEAMNAFGDTATGIVQPARNDASAFLGIGCQGDRWRLVAIGPPPGGGIRLDDGGKVSISLGKDFGPTEKWGVRRRGAGKVTYLAPAPSNFVREMLSREKASADAVFRVRVKSSGKPLVLEFPLAGLHAAIRKDLWEPCKLGNAIPESEFDRQ
jgi:hypothetical protein